MSKLQSDANKNHRNRGGMGGESPFPHAISVKGGFVSAIWSPKKRRYLWIDENTLHETKDAAIDAAQLAQFF